MTIDSIASLLSSLGLLESTMKSLANILSRAFLDHLFENPVGWQFVYTKHDPTAPSITMRPTDYRTEDLTPHGCIPQRPIICFKTRDPVYITRYPSHPVSSLHHISNPVAPPKFPYYITFRAFFFSIFHLLISRSYLRLPRMHLRFPLLQPPRTRPHTP